MEKKQGGFIEIALVLGLAAIGGFFAGDGDKSLLHVGDSKTEHAEEHTTQSTWFWGAIDKFDQAMGGGSK